MKEKSTAEDVGALRNRIFNACLRMIGSREDAEDLTSQTILQAIVSLDSFREDSALYTWLYRIAVNLCKNHLKQVGRRSRMEEVSLDQPSEESEYLCFGGLLSDDPWSTDPRILCESKEVRLALIEALRRESGRPTTRGAEFLVAFYYHGMKYKEIARQFGTTPLAVKSELHRARTRMKLYLASQFESREL